jgi:hypothetical protein
MPDPFVIPGAGHEVILEEIVALADRHGLWTDQRVLDVSHPSESVGLAAIALQSALHRSIAECKGTAIEYMLKIPATSATAQSADVDGYHFSQWARLQEAGPDRLAILPSSHIAWRNPLSSSVHGQAVLRLYRSDSPDTHAHLWASLLQQTEFQKHESPTAAFIRDELLRTSARQRDLSIIKQQLSPNTQDAIPIHPSSKLIGSLSRIRLYCPNLEPFLVAPTVRIRIASETHEYVSILPILSLISILDRESKEDDSWFKSSGTDPKFIPGPGE